MADKLLWSPGQERLNHSQMTKFQNFVGKKDYAELHQWSVNEAPDFWKKLIEFYDVKCEGNLEPACEDLSFKTYSWFNNVKLNFAQNLLRHTHHGQALTNVLEDGSKRVWSYEKLYSEVGSFQHYIKRFIREGDVLAAYMPNIAETAISMLACSSLGGVFTSTSCDFGVAGVVDRFGQARPKVLVAAVSYKYNGKVISQLEKIEQIVAKVDSIEKVILVDFLNEQAPIITMDKALSWQEATEVKSELEFVKVAFSAPLYIMYSSGTTGKPKGIVHSVGGTLLQHIKELGLHTNLSEKKNIFYFTTCGWMMWNWLISSLYFGANVILYEGSPGYPSLGEFFSIIEKEDINIFGTSPKFLKVLEDSGQNEGVKLDSLETILSTGAPLLPEQFDFVYDHLKKDLCLSSICGGTDIIGCFMLGNPNLPVYRGEIQCLGLGMDVDCFDSLGRSLQNQEGELVCKKSFPSRPIYFLNDESGERMAKAYFSSFANVWTHGDFVTITDRGSVKVFGRSDATLNPGGVRIGTSEIYRQTQALQFLEDSACVGKEVNGDIEVVLFVVMKKGESLDQEKITIIKDKIKKGASPRHVPRQIYQVKAIPYTRSGKKMELAITRVLQNKEIPNLEAVSNPESLEQFKKYI